MAETGRFFDRDNDLNSHAAIIIELHDYGHKGHVRTLAYVMKERSCVDVNRKRKYTEEACSTSNITHKRLSRLSLDIELTNLQSIIPNLNT